MNLVISWVLQILVFEITELTIAESLALFWFTSALRNLHPQAMPLTIQLSLDTSHIVL
jgi:hypothetical protein